MSDITKKIFSIEPVEPAATSKPPISDIIQPVLTDSPNKPHVSPKDTVPEFVTREVVSPLSAPPTEAASPDPESESAAAGWILMGFGLAYLIGAGLYFGLPLLNKSTDLFAVAGLAVLMTLPPLLLFLLWRALGHIRLAHQKNARFSAAAEALVSPDREA